MKTSDQIKPLSDHQDSTGESLESGPHLFPPSISGVDERVLVSNMNQNKTADMNLEIGLIVELARTLTSTCQPTWKHFAHCGVFYFLRCRRLRVTRRNTKQRENKVSNIAASILSLSPHLAVPFVLRRRRYYFYFFAPPLSCYVSSFCRATPSLAAHFFPSLFLCVCVCVCVCVLVFRGSRAKRRPLPSVIGASDRFPRRRRRSR